MPNNTMEDSERKTALERLLAASLAPNDLQHLPDLMDEHLASLSEPDAGRVHAISIPGTNAATIVVEDPFRPRAWLLGVSPSPATAPHQTDQVLEAAETLLRRSTNVPMLLTGGPPGSYLSSGLDTRDDATIRWFTQRDYVLHSRHVDFRVTLASPATADPRVRRADPSELDPLSAWIEALFGPAWRRETRRALLRHQGVFVSGEPPEYLGFAAHSGHNAALGTFGPLGVAPHARGRGLGAALARAALDDLRARGFTRATIPWVDPALTNFYRRLVDRIEPIPRTILFKTL